ncbi:MAG: benzoylformate decarboxylase, partial [Rubrobacter sp.]|nr:benzoylformate decarboxylase [Rubrobacter sp.]
GAALANLHSAAGLGHALGSVLAAYRNQTPLILTAGQQTRAMLPSEPYLYAEKPTEFPEPYVKYSVEPARPADVPAAIARAYHTAMTPPRGPVFVSIPEDDWDAPAEPAPAHTVVHSLGADPEAISRFAEKLGSSNAPALVVGPGVDGDEAGHLAVELAERLKAAVYVAPWSSRCSFPERHPLFSGFLSATRSAVRGGLDGHDVVLVAGAQAFTYHVHEEGQFLTEGTELLHMTDNPAQAFAAVAGESLICSPRPGLRALLEAVPEADRADRSLPEPWQGPAAPEAKPGERLPAGAVLARLSELLPQDTAIFEEATAYRRAIREQLPIPEPGLFHNSFSGGLGWALPASVGASIADASRRTLCIVGDGATMYSVQALWTAAQRELPLTVVVLNNGEYGALKGFLDHLGADGFPGSDLPGLDLVSEARGLGCSTERVEDASGLDEALRRALGEPGPYVLDVSVASVRGSPL